MLRRFCLFVLIPWGALSSLGCLPEYTENRSYTLPHVSDSDLVVETRNGTVNVRRGRSESVEIDTEFRSHRKSRLDRLSLERFRDEHNTLHLRLIGLDDDDDGASISVRLPDVRHIDVSTTNGEINVSEVRGSLALRTSNGDLDLSHIEGPIAASTTNGDARLNNVVGAVQLSSTNGSLHVRLNDANSSPVRLQTTNGEVELSVGHAFRGLVHARTSDASVHWGPFPEDYDVRPSGSSIQFGDTNQISEVTTSNGEIIVSGL